MQEQRFLLITIILVALIGAPAVYSVVKDPTQMKNSQKQLSPASSQRQPASVERSENLVRNSIKSKSVVLDYPCNTDKPVLEVDGSLLRLKGGSCISEKWQNVSVMNQANGFTGSVIFLKDDQFTTDFIDLQEGDNQIQFQATDENGKAITRTLTVKSRLPASVEE